MASKQEESTPQSIVLSAHEAAARLGITTHVLYSLTRTRGRNAAVPLPHLKIGRKLYVRPEALTAWVAAREAERMGAK